MIGNSSRKINTVQCIDNTERKITNPSSCLSICNVDTLQMTSDVQTRVEGNQVHITCNAEGYAPEEIKVTVEGNDVVVNAEHVVDTGGKKVQKSYSRRIGLPRDVMKNTVKCNLNGGQLVITAQIPVEPKSTITSSFKSVSIPVHFK